MSFNTGTWSETAGLNVFSQGVAGSGGVNIDEGMARSDVNNALRDIMAQIETWRTAMVEAGGFEDIFVSEGGVITFGAASSPGDVVQLSHGSGVLVMKRTDSGSIGATLNFLHDSTSPNVNDRIASLQFFGNDAGGNSHPYGFIRQEIISPTDGSETGRLVLSSTILDVRGDLLCTTGNRKTAQATTSGTSIDFTDIPAGTRQITIGFASVSTSGTSVPIVRLGDSGGVENTGYLGSSTVTSGGTSSTTTETGGFRFGGGAAGNSLNGSATLTLIDSATNTWSCAVNVGLDNSTTTIIAGGSKALSATLDRVRLTTVNGTDTFDAGLANIIYS